MILVFDVESTGLPVEGAPAGDQRHPDIVSITAILDGPDGNIAEIFTALNKDAKESEPGAFNVHGITKKRCEEEGIPASEILLKFRALAEKAELLSSYNFFFDWKLVKILCARVPGGEDHRKWFETRKSVCSMLGAADFLIGKKRISLKNAYWELFKRETQTDKFHGSEKDARAAREVYYELIKRGYRFVPQPMARREYSTPLPSSAPARTKGVASEVDF